MNKNSKYFVQYFCRNRIWCKIWSQSWQRRLWAYRKNIFRGIQREYLPDWSNRTIQRAYRLLSGTCSGRSDIPDQGKQEYQDNTDRIEVERTFSLSKRCYGMSCITTKLEETQLTSIALSVFVTNLFRIQRRILYALLHLFRFWHDWNRCKSCKLRISA